jgi:hypothetical protein
MKNQEGLLNEFQIREFKKNLLGLALNKESTD